MEYLILAYGNQQDYDHLSAEEGGATPQEVAAVDDFLAGFTGALADSGELVETQGLAASSCGTGLRSSQTGRSAKPKRSSPGTGWSTALVSTARPRSRRDCSRRRGGWRTPESWSGR